MTKNNKYKVEAFNLAVGVVSTIRDVLRLAVSCFRKNELYYGHGTDNAYDEAVYLILHTLNLPIDQLEPYLDAKLLTDEINQLLTVLDLRISKRLPAPYITHEAICQGYSFYVDERVIIPRSYLAEIISNDRLKPWIEYPELVHNILDLCTGNSSVAVIAADYFQDSQVVASDIGQDALDVAAINIKKYALEDRITLCKSDLFNNLNKYKNTFDLILTNPPYVDKLRMDMLPPEYLHEPILSLAGGDDGLLLVDKILKKTIDYLSDFGVLVLEMGNNLSEIEGRYTGLNFTWVGTENNQGFVFVVTKQELLNYFSS